MIKSVPLQNMLGGNTNLRSIQGTAQPCVPIDPALSHPIQNKVEGLERARAAGLVRSFGSAAELLDPTHLPDCFEAALYASPARVYRALSRRELPYKTSGLWQEVTRLNRITRVVGLVSSLCSPLSPLLVRRGKR